MTDNTSTILNDAGAELNESSHRTENNKTTKPRTGLRYPNNTIQYAGVVLRLGGVVVHGPQGFPVDVHDYLFQLLY